MNSIEKALSRLSEFLKSDSSKSTDKILDNFGVSKEEMLNKLNNVDKDEVISKISDTNLLDKLNSLTPEDIDKIKDMAQNKDSIKDLYKKFINSKEGD